MNSTTRASIPPIAYKAWPTPQAASCAYRRAANVDTAIANEVREHSTGRVTDRLVPTTGQ